ncbi:DUF4886 domain-containing protein [Myroides sp. 1354]|uniref:DUF4886 domain-containing protein n=1 Tax=unclassified Myroides TaxID=2642485 RepID=UPI002575EDD4|nr:MULTISPECIES: DUF4886 domain-containing protein [unclassified Myroides]MDM1045332.1 DUF4886 domain-containing protein [Myroides sp. R163-1]MDM1056431.1 DUF4886 domain-containing protein [Myroides sp. 1354]MDM1069463.1 DUF4886 domain-containing protein [Myroides sp. 1372]
MKQLYLLFFFLFTVFSSFGQIRKSVYFIGNSYTSYNNLPALIKSAAQSTGDILTYEQTTPGGSSLQDHMYNQTVTDKINSKAWDYVVLQEQSQRPALESSYTQPYAAILNDRIKNSSSCAKTLFYLTWGHKNGVARNCEQGLRQFCSYEAMDDAIYASYMEMATNNAAHVSPVGKVWRTIRQQYPTYELFDRDNYHPSPLGSMVAAYTFYTVIFKKDPTAITFNGSLTAEQARNIKRIVKEIVYDDFEKWFIGVHYNKAKYEYEITDSSTVRFTNTTPNTQAVQWDFGDGTTSTELNPIHQYEQIGQFTVTLTVTSCNDSYTYTETINIETLSTTKFDKSTFAIYPNPTRDYLFVQTDLEATFNLFDMTGKRITPLVNQQAGQYQLDVRALTRGTYLLQMKTSNSQEQFKFVIK